VKLLRASRHRLTFLLASQEKQVFGQLLELYPRILPAHHRVSKSASSPHPEESQRLLDEELAEQRAAHKKQIRTLLNHPERFEPAEKGEWRLSISRTEGEWLLQVLNDIRVGSWLNLGSPEDIRAAFNDNTAADFWAMEVSGFFQIQLLGALNRERGDQRD